MSDVPPSVNQISRAEELIALLCETQITAAEVAELDQLVVQFPHIRRSYVELMSLHSDLRQQAALLKPTGSTDILTIDAIDLNETLILPSIESELLHDVEKPTTTNTSAPLLVRRNSPWRLVASIVLPLLAAGILWFSRSRPAEQCVINLAIDAKWVDTSDPAPISGSTLTPGLHNLGSGVINLALPGNAIVAIESPAQFQVLSSDKIQLFQGKLCAQLIKGGSLTAITPDLTSVDEGTEFALEVSAGKQTHLEVLQGKVRANLPGPSMSRMFKIITAGEAVVVVAGSTTIQADTPRPLAFVRPSQMQAAAQTSYQQWTRFSQTVRQDVDLVAYYPFDGESASSNKLENRAVQTAGSYDGAMGASGIANSIPIWTKGRWPGKSALQFGGARLTAITVNARPDLIPRAALTLCCWIKPADLSKPLHLLAGEDENGRALNLGIVRKDALDAFNRINATWSQLNVSSTPCIFQPDHWAFVAITSTVANGTQFYLNGKLVSSSTSPSSVPVVVKQLVIGAPVPANKLSNPGEYFNGLMDELLIYRRALSSEEIEQLFKMGSPD